MGMFKSPWAIVVVVLVVVLLFGANKLPGLARNMGKSMRIFKTEVEEMRG
ncbi:MAG: twin-arginine translocase TatA/TatE family subunit, partial [Brachybacterium tyrofermentans]